jgi:hypothetical protein
MEMSGPYVVFWVAGNWIYLFWRLVLLLEDEESQHTTLEKSVMG